MGLVGLLTCLPCAAQEQGAGNTVPTRTGAVVVPRFGILLLGESETDIRCSDGGSLEGSCPSVSRVDNDDESRFALGIDVLGNLASNFRLGGGLWFVPSTEVDPETGRGLEWGSDLSGVLIVEGLLDASSRTALAGRLMVGALMLFPGEDLEDGIEASERECDALQAQGASCEVNGGPYVGPTVGGGFGVVGSVGRVALRGDLLFLWYYLPFIAQRASGNIGTFDLSTSLTGTRFWLSGGVEF